MSNNAWIYLNDFFISNTFLSTARLKLAKNQENIKQHLRLNFCYLKIIHILHPRYHPKITGHIIRKYANEQVCLLSLDYMLNHNENENENEKNSHRYDIDTGLGNDTNIINAKSSSV